MVDIGFLTETEFEILTATPLGIVANRDRSRVGPYYVEEVRQSAVEKKGNEQVLTGGLNIKTCMDLKHQIAAESAVAAGYRRFKEMHADGGEIQIALVALRPGAGDVHAGRRCGFRFK